MPIIAKLSYLRIAHRKVRLVVDLIRGKPVEEAQVILSFTIKRAAKPVLKLLKSAVANAKHNFQIEDNLYITKITVDGGPMRKKARARARGLAFPIQKKTSHITLILDTIAEKKKLRKITKSTIIKKTESIEKTNKNYKIKKPKLRAEKKILKPKIETGIKRVFRRKAF